MNLRRKLRVLTSSSAGQITRVVAPAHRMRMGLSCVFQSWELPRIHADLEFVLAFKAAPRNTLDLCATD